MSGPVKVAEQAVTDGVFDHDDQLARRVLTAVHTAGWRIVRTEDLRCPKCDRWPQISCSVDGVLPYEDQAERIVEEWTP